jgi:hypothetical protein
MKTFIIRRNGKYGYDIFLDGSFLYWMVTGDVVEYLRASMRYETRELLYDAENHRHPA